MDIGEDEFVYAITEIKKAIDFEEELIHVMGKYTLYDAGTPSDECVDLCVELLAELTHDQENAIEEFCFGQAYINDDEADGIVIDGQEIKTPEDLYEYLDANWRGDYDQRIWIKD